MKVLHLFYFVTALFTVLAGHLFKMQIVDYPHYKAQSERNRIRPVILEAPRGQILDRYGREIVSNRLAFDCYIIPQEVKPHLERTLIRLAPILNEAPDTLSKKYHAKKRSSFTPVFLAEDITKEQAIAIEESTDSIPGVFIKTRPVREYKLGDAAAHITGYIGALTREEYNKHKDEGYAFSDEIGKSGLEKAFEGSLKGRDGAVQYEADSRGRLLRVLNIQEPVEGKPLTLTIDRDLQMQLMALMQGQAGGAAVMDLATGGLLALVSSPSYDPNFFAQPSRHRAELKSVLGDAARPLVNRCFGEYPPGSTFKIVTAYAGLKRGKITQNTTFLCPGFYMMGKHRFKCWNHAGHGPQSVEQALEHSCNVFFFNTGNRLDVTSIAEEARNFGYGTKTKIEIPGEKAGLVPSREWKKLVFHKNPEWYRGETVIFAIGQGFLLATPLQVLRSAAVPATDGYLPELFLVQRVGETETTRPRPRLSGLSEQALAPVREGLRRVVQSDTGTGQRARTDKTTVSGKTGTAQAAHGNDHAWFVGYASSENPSVAIVIFLEHGGKGGVSAATVAGRAFDWMGSNGYFGSKGVPDAAPVVEGVS